jgi:hypothetical protein
VGYLLRNGALELLKPHQAAFVEAARFYVKNSSLIRDARKVEDVTRPPGTLRPMQSLPQHRELSRTSQKAVINTATAAADTGTHRCRFARGKARDVETIYK